MLMGFGVAGGLLDYDAVVEGLASGKVGGLGLDVQWQEPFDPHDPLAAHPRCTRGNLEGSLLFNE